ncbi:MAG: hypothetical protein DRO06_04400 [Thermoproteota archaeon]|nr:MAG: hypothetical protein DRO06_04400 [Candidatus Korarchaeota archaeon]
MSLALLSLFEAVSTLRMVDYPINEEAVSRAVRTVEKLYEGLESPALSAGLSVLEEIILSGADEDLAIAAARQLAEVEREAGVDWRSAVDEIVSSLRSDGEEGLANLTLLMARAKER